MSVALAAKAQLSAYVAHEINGPLAGIKSAFTLLGTAVAGDHKYRPYVDMVTRELDRIRDTASSHGRLFLIEVMGRSSGMLAVHTAVACGAEAVLYPESPEDSYENLVSQLNANWLRGKRSSIVVVAEGDTVGRAVAVGERLKRDHDLDLRVVVLGHIQRGGSPTATDRIWGSRWGAEAVRRLDKGERGFYLGEVAGALVAQPLSRVLEAQPVPPGELGRLISVLAR